MKRIMVSVATVICAVVSSAAPASAGTGWRVVPAPVPPKHIGYLTSVSCLPTGDCTAVGTSFYKGSQYTLAERWDGSTWAIQHTPNPAGTTAQGTKQAELDAVSCASLTNCTAVGFFYTFTGGGNQPLAEHWDGSRWTIQPLPKPAAAARTGGGGNTVPEEGFLNGVSCVSPVDCNAVGLLLPARGVLPLAEHWNGTRWTAEPTPLPRLDGAPVAGAKLEGVSCPAISACIAVGSYDLLNQNAGLFAERWNGSRWTARVLPHPAGQSFVLQSVSCPSAQSCTAAGGSTSEPIIERYTGTSWTLQADAAPAKTVLFGVSCPSAQSCTAVGSPVHSPSGKAVAEHWDGTKWALQATPAAPGPTPLGVSCTGSLTCTMAGIEGDKGFPERPLIEQEG